jgi:UDP-glucoronosyl and UDP-glucosyl transferase
MATLSDIFRTNQNNPLETAVWWIEYVIKYKGAPHLQSPAKNLPWFRYLQLDIVFVLFGIIYMIYDLIKQQFDKSVAKPSEAKKNNKIEASEANKNKSEPSKKKNKEKKKEN